MEEGCLTLQVDEGGRRERGSLGTEAGSRDVEMQWEKREANGFDYLREGGNKNIRQGGSRK